MTSRALEEEVSAAQVLGATSSDPAESEAGVMDLFAEEGAVKLEGPW
jgi:hypothetical protein